MTDINQLITTINDALWSYVLIGALVGCGLWFTWKTRFVQFRMVGEMLRLLTESAVDSVKGVKDGAKCKAGCAGPALGSQGVWA